jgi:predicted porin
MTITPNSPARFNNAITYTSATYSGFKVVPSTASARPARRLQRQAGQTTDNLVYGLGLNYANGPINFDAGLASRTNGSHDRGGTSIRQLAGTGKSINEWYVGGSYDFKVVKAFASYQALTTRTTRRRDR